MTPRDDGPVTYVPNYISFAHPDVLGESPYFEGDGGKLCVALALYGLQPTAPYSPFEDAIKAKSAANGDQPYLLVEKPESVRVNGGDEDDDDDDDDDDAERERAVATDATHRVLWLPHGFKEIRARVGDHIARGVGEPSDIQRRLDKGNTDSGHVTELIIRAEFNAIDETRPRGVLATADVPRRVATLLALTEAMADNPIWLHDTEDEEGVAETLGAVAKVWRNKHLVHKNDARALGLGARDDGDGARAESRGTLLALLDIFKGRFAKYGHDFNFKPGPPRKRKAAAPAPGAAARVPLGSANRA